MAKFGLVPYSIRIKDSEAGGDFIPVRKFDGISDLSDVLKVFLDRLNSEVKVSGAKVDETSQSVFSIKHFKEIKDAAGDLTFTAGILQSGEYGEESELFDTITRTSSKKKERHEAEMLPFFFLLEQPPMSCDEAIVIFQTYKQFGIKTRFLKEFVSFFHKSYPRYRLQIGALMPPDVLNKILSESVKEINFIRYDTKAIEKSFDSGHEEIAGRIVLSVKPSRGFNLPILEKMKAAINRGNAKISEVFEFTDDLKDFHYEDVNVVVEYDGMKRTISLKELSMPTWKENIDTVKTDPSGHPEFDDIADLAKSISTNLRTTI
jgi:hypothetical protein